MSLLDFHDQFASHKVPQQKYHNYGMPAFKQAALGGLSGLLQGLQEGYNNQRAMDSRMALEQMKAKNNYLMRAMASESRQKSYFEDKNSPDGVPTRYTYRNVMNPDGSWSREQTGQIALSDLNKSKGASKGLQLHNVREGDQQMAVQFDPATGEEKVLHKGSLWAPQRGDIAAASEAGKNNRAIAAEVNKRMKVFDSISDPQSRAAILKANGIDPNAPDAETQLRDAYAAKQRELVEGKTTRPQPKDKPSSKNMPSTQDGLIQDPDTKKTMTKDGQPVKYDAKGNPWVMGPNGQPIPYNPQADNTPLAGDQAMASLADNPDLATPQEPQDQVDEDGNPITGEEDQQSQGHGLLTQNDNTDSTGATDEQAEAQDDQDDDSQRNSDEHEDSPDGQSQRGLLT
jgi:hypothetical protein